MIRIAAMTAVSVLALSVSTGGAAFANSVKIQQAPIAPSESAGFTSLNLNQQVNGGNDMDIDVKGAVGTMRINQAGTGNELTMTLSATDTATGNYQIDYVGNDNTHTLVVGDRKQPDRRFSDPQYTLMITGASNTVTDGIRGGATLDYTGTITGDGNTVDVGLGRPTNPAQPSDAPGGAGVGGLDLNYTIEGDGNAFNFIGGVLGYPDAKATVSIQGDRNTVGYVPSLQDGVFNEFDGEYQGDDISSSVSQTGSDGLVDVKLTKTGPGAFTHLVAQNFVANAQAVMDITANGAGSFNLTQNSPGANFNATMTVVDGGTVTATQ